MNTTLHVPAGAPYLSQYFGVWAIHEDHADMLLAHVQRVDLVLHLQQQEQAAGLDPYKRSEAAYEVTKDGVAVVSLSGPMTKHSSSLFSGASTLKARRQVQAAARDPEVKGVLLVVDSPGGSVAGTDELGRAVARANRAKPVWAAVDDLAASAGYWVASQAGRVWANRSAVVGSIGVYTVVQDSAEADAKNGRKVHIVKFGQHKAIGAGGPVTEDQLAEVQRLVDQRGEQFIAAVAEGRGRSLDEVRLWADGRVEMADTALRLGMIDEIGGYDEAYEALVATLNQPRKGKMMSAEADPPKTFAQQAKERRDAIAKACPNADQAFLDFAVARGDEPLEAAVAWQAELGLRLKTAQEEAEAAKLGNRGNKPLGDAGDPKDLAGDPGAEVIRLRDEHVARGLTTAEAMVRVNKSHPELVAAWRQQVNAAAKR